MYSSLMSLCQLQGVGIGIGHNLNISVHCQSHYKKAVCFTVKVITYTQRIGLRTLATTEQKNELHNYIK